MTSPSHLVIATTRTLSSLPRRCSPGLDNAIIVPLPPPPRSSDSDSESEDEDVAAVDNNDPDVERMEIDNRAATLSISKKSKASNNTITGDGEEADEDDEDDYTLLLSSVRDRRACIIRREDGFEKRLLWRCGRCRLIFGYQIADDLLDEQEKEREQGTRRKKKGAYRRKKGYVYILPGGVTSAEEMGSLGEKEVALGGET